MGIEGDLNKRIETRAKEEVDEPKAHAMMAPNSNADRAKAAKKRKQASGLLAKITGSRDSLISAAETLDKRADADENLRGILYEQDKLRKQEVKRIKELPDADLDTELEQARLVDRFKMSQNDQITLRALEAEWEHRRTREARLLRDAKFFFGHDPRP